MDHVATRGRRVDRRAETSASSTKPKATRTSSRHLTPSEFAELFPVHCASWERENGQSTGDFVQSYRSWDWWLTLTFRQVVSGTFALTLLKQWASDLARELDSHASLAIEMELQHRGAPHFHVLMHIHQNVDAFDAGAAEKSWRALSKRCGTKNTFEPFDPDRRGGEYLTKEGAWGLLVACPRVPSCRRSGGCRVDPHAW